MCFKQDGNISTLSCKLLKLVDQFTYLGSYISSTGSSVNIYIRHGLLLTDCQSYGNLFSLIKKDRISSKLWQCKYYDMDAPLRTTQKCYLLFSGSSNPQNNCYTATWLLSQLPKMNKHCWRSKDELISGILLWTPTFGHTTVGQPAKIYIHELHVDTECSLEDLLG